MGFGSGGKRVSTRRRALVTGASAGIGTAFAERLAADGWDLCIVARRRQRLATLARQLRARHGGAVDIVAADLTDGRALRRLERRIAEDERLDLLVNNAGVADFGHFVERDRDVEEREIQLDVVAVVRLTHAVLPGMIRRGRGAVINVSSVAALTPGPNYAVYSGCKSFINTFTEALHFELAGKGVAFQVLCPGLTHTEIFAVAGADTSAVPEVFWMDAEAVVDASLAALRRGTLVCVPGLTNQALTSLSSLLPREAVGRLAFFLSEHSIVSAAPRRKR